MNRLNTPFKFVRNVEVIQQRLIPLLFFCLHVVNITWVSGLTSTNTLRT
ncbi:hypothetical protein BN1182_BH_02420 [Pantoea ananatis]|nr:hypothetical protein BN1182_BH_02420 [Pantoea ananatis]CRH34184.1 hypothetical protein BN1183_BA_00630 [Pantoea ananatis]